MGLKMTDSQDATHETTSPSVFLLLEELVEIMYTSVSKGMYFAKLSNSGNPEL
jgi:hypothetical protein